MRLRGWIGALIGFIIALTFFGGTLFLTMESGVSFVGAQVGTATLVAALAGMLPVFFVLIMLLTGIAALASGFPRFLDFFVALGALLIVLAVVSAVESLILLGLNAPLAVLVLCLNAGPHVLLTLVAYVMAAIAAGIGAPAAAFEDEMRGCLIGINAAANLVFAVLVYPALVLLHVHGALALFLSIWLIGFVGFMAILPLYRTDSATDDIVHPDARSLLGWASSLQPTAWFTETLGLLLHLLSLLVHTLAIPLRCCGPTPLLTITAIELARDTGTITMRGGIASNFELGVAYNLGRFSFVRSVDIVAGAATTPSPTVVAHEAGHHLNLAAFGTAFHFIGFIEEMLQAAWGALGVVIGGKPPTQSGSYAYAEQLATTNAPLTPPPQEIPTSLSMWVR